MLKPLTLELEESIQFFFSKLGLAKENVIF